MYFLFTYFILKVQILEYSSQPQHCFIFIQRLLYQIRNSVFNIALSLSMKLNLKSTHVHLSAFQHTEFQNNC